MSNLLTPAELAAIAERRDKAAARLPEVQPFEVACFVGIDGPALLRHIAALEARTPAPATDVDALLADLDAEAARVDRNESTMEGELLREAATALRESRAREVAEPYRHALEQRLICSNLPLLTGDADADLMRFVFHEQELALSPEAGVIAELKEQRDTALSWTAIYTNMDVYRRCLATAIARAEKAEAERDAAQHGVKEVAGIFKIVMPRPGTDIAKICLKNAALKRERDAAIARAEKAEAEQQTAYAAGDRVGYHNACSEKNLALQKANADLAAARAELGALGPVEWETQTARGAWAPASPLDAEDANVRAIRVVKEAQ